MHDVSAQIYILILIYLFLWLKVQNVQNVECGEGGGHL